MKEANNTKTQYQKYQKECIGCCIYEVCIIRNSENPNKLFQVKSCPCRLCIVKVICTVDNPCELYSDWLEKSEKS